MFKTYNYFKGEKEGILKASLHNTSFCEIFVALFNAIFVALELETEIARGVDKARNMEHPGTSRNIPEHPGTGQIITK